MMSVKICRLYLSTVFIVLIRILNVFQIVTRNMNSIRGHCTGYVVAFDKHWNIALEDVREVWARAKKLKQPALGTYVYYLWTITITSVLLQHHRSGC